MARKATVKAPSLAETLKARVLNAAQLALETEAGELYLLLKTATDKRRKWIAAREEQIEGFEVLESELDAVVNGDLTAESLAEISEKIKKIAIADGAAAAALTSRNPRHRY